MMMKLRTSTLLTALSLFGLNASIAATPVDQAVAIVNNQVITQQGLTVEESFLGAQMRGQSQQAVAKMALENLITQKVLLELAQKNNITASSSLVDTAFANVAKQNRLTPSQFTSALKKQGISPETYRNFLQNQLIIRNLEQRVLAGAKIQVSDAEVAQYLQHRNEQIRATTRYRVNTILIPLANNQDPILRQQAKSQVDQVLKQLKSGQMSFAQAAKKYSKGANPNNSGSLGWLTLDQLPTVLTQPIQKLGLGKIAGPIATGGGYLIVQLAGKKSDQSQPSHITENKVRQIVLKTTPIFSDEDAVLKLRELRAQLTAKKISFAKVAQTYSEDPNSSAKGGELGWTLPGQLPPELEQQIDKLKVNTVSEPIRTAQDWRLIEVTARRQVDASDTLAKAQARQAIFVRKADAFIRNWRKQMRDQAYVQVLQ